MKSLILKDLYNMAHNLRAMMLSMIIIAFCLTPSVGISGSVAMCGMMFGMFIVSSFAMDEQCNWNRFALMMPISKKDIIKAKYVVLVLFIAVGLLVGILFGSIVNVVMNKQMPDILVLKEIALTALTGFSVTYIIMGMTVPLVIMYGVEKGRLFIILCTLIPAGIVYGAYEILNRSGVVISEDLVMYLVYFSPLIALLWNYVMYCISYRIFLKKEW